MQLKAFLFMLVCSMVFFKASAISLPYEVEETLLRLLAEKDLQNLDTSKRSVIPIYRKDLDPNYIAYYQIDIHGKHFYILSAGPRTGDHEEAQSGPPPLPTKVLRDQAKQVGQVCSKFFMLSSMGLYMCENLQGRAVAATYDWNADAPVSNWKRLQKMVENSLGDFKRAWRKVAVSSMDEWKISQRKPANKKPGLTDYDAEIVSPGSTAKMALENNHANMTIHAIPSSKQSQLCKVLVKVCTDHDNAVNQDLIHKTKSGIGFLEFRVKGGRNYVRNVLRNKEISFYFKVETKSGEQVLKYFSIDLSRHRHRRSPWSSWDEWSVAHEHLFPEYDQHKCCGCMSGCGPVAWAQILAFYDRLAHNYPSSGYSKRFWSCADGSANGCEAPNWMNNDAKKYILGIRSTLGTFCLFGGGATTPHGMTRIANWYRARGIGGRISSHFTLSSLIGWTHDRYRVTATDYIKEGYPAIVGKWVKGSKQKAMHYAVATRYKVRQQQYRSCFLVWCSNKTRHERRFYLHMGWGGSSNGWYDIKAFGAYAAKKI